MGPIEIKTARLLLREYRWDDLDKHHALISDPEIMYYIQDVYSRSLQESEENLKLAIEAIGESPRTHVFLVIETKGGAYVGGIGYTITESSPAGSRAEIGYFTYPEQGGKGYAAEALSAMLSYAFLHGGVRRMSGTCIEDNVSSARLMERCGMRLEGIRRGHEWHVDGVKSRRYYGLLAEEWKEEHCGRSSSDTTEEEHQEVQGPSCL